MPKNFLRSSPTLRVANFANLTSAFTLVEIVVVMGIVAILAALIISALDPAQLRRSARDANRQKDLGIISTALEQFYSDQNEYPNETDIDCLKENLDNVQVGGCTGDHTTGNIVYIRAMPRGQTNNLEYCYNRFNPQNFTLCAPTEAITTASTVPNACVPGAPTGVTGLHGAVDGYGSICVTNPF